MPGLNHKQKLFAVHYATGPTAGNATKSAVAAGYSARTSGSAGPRLLGNVALLALIETHRAKVVAKSEVKGEKILRELDTFAHSDILDAFNNGERCSKCGHGGGTLKHPADMSPEVRRAIKSLEFTELFEGSSGEKFIAGRVVKMQLWSKEAGLKMLGDNIGLWKTAAEKKIDESLAELLARAREPEAGE